MLSGRPRGDRSPIVWAVAIANAVNLVDGLDGLAAGMVAIASPAFFIYVVRSAPGRARRARRRPCSRRSPAASALGFLPWNFHPAKIFMGDAGSMLLGMLLAIATIEGVGRQHRPSRRGGDIAAFLGAIAVPLLVLLVPFLDVVLAIFRRDAAGGQGSATRTRSTCITG